MTVLVDRLAELTGLRDRDVLDVTLVTSLRELLQTSTAAIYRCIGDADNRRWLTRARLDGHEATAQADSAWVALESLPRLDAHPTRHRCFVEQAMLEDHGDDHAAFHPLSTDRETVGVLELRRSTPLSAEEQRVVHGATGVYRNFLSLLDYSERDTLTGLLNRKTFDEAFMKTLAGRPKARAGQADGDVGVGGRGYWIGVIDIDHFKRVNDRYGHLIGDEVLLLLARLMRASFRLHDRLYRFGGEEFVVLLHCGGETDPGIAFNRFRLNVEAYAFPQVGRITASVGMSRRAVPKANTAAHSAEVA